MTKTLKILALLAVMSACGVAAFGAAMMFLMNLGTKYHNNYEYYGSTAALFFVYGMSIVGFAAPGALFWHQRKKERPWQFSVRTLLIVMTLVAAVIGMYAFSL